MLSPNQRVHRTRKQVEDVLARFDASESTQAVFAKDQNLSLSTLRFWIARRRREAATSAPASRYVPVSVTRPIETWASGLELEFGEDRRLHIPSDTDTDALARLLPIIVAAC